MHRTLLRITAITVLSFAAMRVQAQPRPTAGSEDIRPLFSSSNVVCVGRVVSISDLGGPTVSPDNSVVRAKLGTVLVERYYKATNESKSIRIRFYAPDRVSKVVTNVQPSLSLSNGEHSLLFLQRNGDLFEFTDPWFSKLPMSSYLAQGSARSGLSLLEVDLEAGLRDPDLQSVRSNLEILGGMKRLEQTTGLRELAGSPDFETKAAALLALQRVGDYSHLERSLEIMSRPDVSPMTVEMRSVLASTFENIDDPKAVPILLRFADSSNSTVRSSVIKALRHLNDPRSVPAMVRRLDDSDFFIRYDAVFTLATIEGRRDDPEWVNAIGAYRAHESKYLTRWKKWWSDEGASRYADTATSRPKL